LPHDTTQCSQTNKPFIFKLKKGKGSVFFFDRSILFKKFGSTHATARAHRSVAAACVPVHAGVPCRAVPRCKSCPVPATRAAAPPASVAAVRGPSRSASKGCQSVPAAQCAGLGPSPAQQRPIPHVMHIHTPPCWPNEPPPSIHVMHIHTPIDPPPPAAAAAAAFRRTVEKQHIESSRWPPSLLKSIIAS
jgi:hypothetical protein